MSYIKKEPLCVWLSNMCVSENIIKAIENDSRFPPADVVEVVRCKDCKHYINGQCFHPRHDHHAQNICQEDNDFCNYGERKA